MPNTHKETSIEQLALDQADSAEESRARASTAKPKSKPKAKSKVSSTAKPKAGSKAGAKAAPKATTKAVTKPEAKSGGEAKPKDAAKAGGEAKSKGEAKAKDAAKPKDAAKSGGEAKASGEAQPKAAAQPKSKPEATSKPAPTPQSPAKPAPTPQSPAKPAPTPQSSAKPEPKPRLKAAPQPLALPTPQSPAKAAPKSESVDESVLEHVCEEKAATELSDEAVIGQVLDNLRKDNESSPLPDPAEVLKVEAPDPEGADAAAQMTGLFGVLDRAQNALFEANERLVAEAKEPPKSYRKLQIGLIIGGAVVLLLAGIFVWYQMQSRVLVPNLVGMSQTDAVAALNRHRLKVGQLLEQEAVTVEPGTVIDQDPIVDVKVARGSAVTLTISKASAQVSVPSVLDKDPTGAAATLTDARLVYGEIKTFSDTVPPGVIVGQLPVAGTTVEGGSKVFVLVSQGAMSVSINVPKVLGLSKSDATKLLADQGFAPLFYYAQTEFGTLDEAVTQTPASTGLALPGSVVMVLISQGNSKSGMIVPDVTGKDEAAAKSALEAAGFNVDVRQIVTSSASAGVVVAQTPQAQGTHLAAGATVGLLVSAGSDPAVKMPSLLGVELATAQKQLRFLGLNYQVVPLPKGQQAGIVTQQFPAGGLDYQLGLPVLLYAPPRHSPSAPVAR